MNAQIQAARDIEAIAADWFGRRQFWNWTAQDQAELDAWLNEALAHKVAYWRLEGAWARTERLNAVRPPVREPVVAATRDWARLLRMVAGTAAVVAIAAVGASAFLLSGKEAKIYSTAVGETETVKFADGSRIELNTDTVLRASITDRHRSVTLEKGEAYFQITHDAAHPFVVMAAGHRVTDLGTKFLVRDEAGQVQVVLVEGKARLEAAGPQARSALLVPGDVAVATADSIVLKKRQPAELANKLSWRSGVLVFDNTTLGDAAAEFNRYNRTKLVIDDPSVARISIAGKFPVNGVDRFADVVTHVFGLRVQSRHEAMVISH